MPSQSQSGDERYHDAPPPTASNRKDAQLSTTVCKRDNGDKTIPSVRKFFAQACRYLPRSLESSFSKRKKKKMGGVFNDMPETFCQREINREMGYLKQSSEGQISRVKYCSREDRITMS